MILFFAGTEMERKRKQNGRHHRLFIWQEYLVTL